MKGTNDAKKFSDGDSSRLKRCNLFADMNITPLSVHGFCFEFERQDVWQDSDRSGEFEGEPRARKREFDKEGGIAGWGGWDFCGVRAIGVGFQRCAFPDRPDRFQA